MSILLLASFAWAADCPVRWTAADLGARLDAVDAAYTALDLDGFTRGIEEARLMLPCVADVVPPDVAARYHRIEGMRLFLAGDPAQADAAFRAARVVAPGWRFPDEMLDASHAMRLHYEGLPTAEGPTKHLPKPAAGTQVWLDGSPARGRPEARDTVFQVSTGDPAAMTTTYLHPGDRLPAYPHVPAHRLPMLVAAGVSVGASGLLYGLAWGAHDAALDREDPTLTTARQEELQSNALALTGSSAGALALGLGLAGVGIFWSGP